jgi:hypothetical protein
MAYEAKFPKCDVFTLGSEQQRNNVVVKPLSAPIVGLIPSFGYFIWFILQTPFS